MDMYTCTDAGVGQTPSSSPPTGAPHRGRSVALWVLSFGLGGALAWSGARADTAEVCETEGYILKLESVSGADERLFRPYQRMVAGFHNGGVAYIKVAPEGEVNPEDVRPTLDLRTP